MVDDHTIRLKLDDGKTVTQQWGRSDDFEALFSRQPIPLAKQLIGSKSLMFEINLLLTYCENSTYAIAAYNAGPTGVNRAEGIPNNESRNEVKRVNNCIEKQLHLPGGLQNPGAGSYGCQ